MSVLFPLLLSGARLLISAWGELEPTRLNLFIFLGEIWRKKERLVKMGPPTISSLACFSL